MRAKILSPTEERSEAAAVDGLSGRDDRPELLVRLLEDDLETFEMVLRG